MLRMRIRVQPGGVALLAVASLSIGMTVAACSSSGHRLAAAGSATRMSTTVSATALAAHPGYAWYRSTMSRSYRSGRMMHRHAYNWMPAGRSRGWLTSRAGYRWMTGGATAPGWMSGGAMPSSRMGAMAGTDPGTVVGWLFAGAPGARISPARALLLSSQLPAGADINRAARTIVFTTRNVHLVVLANPSMQDESYRAAGMTDPAISVRRGAHVTIELINADESTAHGLVIAAFGAARSPMPMMITAPAFRRAALWFLGERTTAGMHAGTLTFTAARPGRYQYLCPVPGAAQLGMAGTFTVR